MAYDHGAFALFSEPVPERHPDRTNPQPFFVDGRALETTPVFDAYWYFAAERQRIFFKRIARTNEPVLSDDPILQDYKFTNAYRASDRVSQYLIRSVIYPDATVFGPEDTFFRILLFKIFNKIETWEALESEFGPICLSKYDFGHFDSFLADRQSLGVTNYAAAYIMPSAGNVFGHKRKHSNHLALIEWMLEKHFPQRLASADTMAEGFDLFLSAPSLGPFLAYQFVTDINYSPLTRFSEMEFVVPGPGALDGISKCFDDTSGRSPTQIIQAVTQQQVSMFKARSIEFPSLWGRPLQMIDCQNLFCEISKYSRVAFPDIAGVAGRTRIKQKYKPTGPTPAPFYPPDWGLNDKIGRMFDQPAFAGSEIARAEQLKLF